MRLEVDLGAVRYDVSMAAERQRLLDTFTAADVVCELFVSSFVFAGPSDRLYMRTSGLFRAVTIDCS